MQITIDLPDNLPVTEADVRRELAIALYQQHNIGSCLCLFRESFIIELVVPTYR